MTDAIRSELRKLLTVRSTYFIVAISLAIVALFAGFGDGFRAEPNSLRSPLLYAHESYEAIAFVGLILALAGLLLMGHEYRYNGIMYTLTSSNRRLKSLLAKVLVVSLFAVLSSALVALFSPVCVVIGAHLAGKAIGTQSFDAWSVLWRCIVCGWGYAMYAFVLVTIIRSQVGSIVTYLMIPLIGESIILSIFKGIGKYLPFSSLRTIVLPEISNTSLGRSVSTVAVYVAAGLAVSMVLFARRDAN